LWVTEKGYPLTPFKRQDDVGGTTGKPLPKRKRGASWAESMIGTGMVSYCRTRFPMCPVGNRPDRSTEFTFNKKIKFKTVSNWGESHGFIPARAISPVIPLVSTIAMAAGDRFFRCGAGLLVFFFFFLFFFLDCFNTVVPRRLEYLATLPERPNNAIPPPNRRPSPQSGTPMT